MSTQLDDGSWEFNVQWWPPGADTRQVDTLGEAQVRKDQVDRSEGRG